MNSFLSLRMRSLFTIPILLPLYYSSSIVFFALPTIHEYAGIALLPMRNLLDRLLIFAESPIWSLEDHPLEHS